MTEQSSNGHLLDVNNIEVVYNDIVQVLRGVSLSVPEGSIVALVTPFLHMPRDDDLGRC